MRNKSKFTISDTKKVLKLRVFGKTLEDLFISSFKGLTHLLYQDYKSAKVASVSIIIKISSVDVNSLLVDFLSEVLYQSELETVIFFNIKIKKFSNLSLVAELSGRRVSKFDRKIKMVNYRDVSVLKGPEDFWQAEIIFDI